MLIIFDLDGTLLNTITDLGYACNFALSKAGFPTHPIESYPSMVGNGVNNLIRRALPASEQTEEQVLRLRQFFVPYYDAHNCDYTHPYKGMPEVLRDLKTQGHLLAVASNKYQAATEKLVRHFFPSLFDIILGERTGIPRKPDPQIVYDIIRMTNMDAAQSSPQSMSDKQVLYIGDSLVDRDTAANAGVPFLACSYGFVAKEKLIASGIEHIIDTPEAISQFVSQL